MFTEQFNPSPRRILTQIISLVVLTILPIVGLIIHFNFRMQSELEKSAFQNLTLISEIAAVEHLQVVEGARQLLIAITSYPQILKSHSCSLYLSELLKNYKRYSNFAIADLEGNIFCSAINNPQGLLNVSDTYFFQETIRRQEFTTGQFGLGKITKKATIYFGNPVFDTNHNMIAVAYASLSLDWLSQLLNQLTLVPNPDIWVLDRQGVVLAQTKNQEVFVGKKFPHSPIDFLLLHPKGILTIQEGNNKSDILYALRSIGGNESGPFILLEFPKETVTLSTKQAVHNDILLSLAILIFSLTLGTLIGRNIIHSFVESTLHLDKMKNDFVALASHQIRTPLTAIRWYAEHLLTSKVPLSKKHTSHVRDISLSAQKIISLVALILETSTLRSENMKLHSTTQDISALFKEAVAEYTLASKKKHVKFQMQSSKHLPHASVDKKLIKQVIMILIDNAIKYSFPSSVIQCGTRYKSKKIVVEITNVGIGIPKEEQKFMFQRFFRASNAQNTSSQGTGLGLYIAKLIVQAHDGKIWFVSKANRTTFAFTLPVV